MKSRACRLKFYGTFQQAKLSETLALHRCKFLHHSKIRRRRWTALLGLIWLAGIPTLFGGAPVAQAAEAALRAPAFGPMYYLEAFGSPGHEIRTILLALTWLSVVVVVIITALVVIGVIRRGRRVDDMETDAISVTRGEDQKPLRWIYAGLVVTVGTLLVFVGWTVSTMAAINSPDATPAATIEVTGHQWWWQVVYRDTGGSVLVRAANEVRVPVGQPVKFVLRSTDVIHSFWVPLLAGKTDMIPGRENVAWLRADRPGVYRGQCVEYCGLQHAQMGFQLIALPLDEFDAWLAGRAETARAGQGSLSPEPPAPDTQNAAALQQGGGHD